MRRRKQGGGIGVVHESSAKPRLVGGVLKEPSNEIRHAGNHLADRDVLANPEAHVARGLLQFRGHPVEHLNLEGCLGQTDFFELGDRRPDRSGIVASEGEFDAAAFECFRRRMDERSGHSFEAGVRVGLSTPDGNRPPHLLRVDRLVVPIGALDEANRHLTAGSLRPLDDPGGVVVPGTQVGLHREARVEVDLFAAPHEQLEGEILERKLLHVEVDQDALLLRLQEQGAERLDETLDRTSGIDGICLRVKRTDLDRDIRSRNGAEMIAFEFFVFGPAIDRVGEIIDQVHVLGAVVRGFHVRDAGFAQKINAKSEASFPEFLKHWQGVGGIGTRDELLGHAGDLLRHRSGEH